MRIKLFLTIVIAFFAVGIFSGPSLSGQGVKVAVPNANVQPELYNQIMVSLDSATNAQQFAQTHGLTVAYQFNGVANTWLFNTTSVASATTLTTGLQGAAGVNWAFQNQASMNQMDAFTPNDPLFNNPAPPDNFGGQWHLGNNLNTLPNVNVAGAWNNDITGAGVMIGIVDSGIEPGHEDIATNFSAANTFDFVNNTALQNLVVGDNHGMSVAGVAAARGGNGIGVTGAAPFAGVSSQKVFQGNGAATSAGFVNATLFNSTGATPSIDVKNHSYGISVPYISTPAEVAALATSASAGTIHTGSAGNGRGTIGQDANKRHFNTSVNQIAVAALGSDGLFASYSNFGANVFVTASSSTSGGFGITTTDRTGALGYNSGAGGDYLNANYTAGFGGTSSAAPLVAGVMALGKQVRPDMDIRLAKHALANTSVIVNAGDATTTSDGGWRTNSGGNTFNQNYGFGLVDASAFVNFVAANNVTPLVVASSGTINVAAAIPDNNLTGISRTAFNGTAGFMEEALVTINATHTYRGDLEGILTSPSGYTSRLFFREFGDGGDNLNWTYTTNAFWGEQALGTWSLQMRDVFAGDIGTWNSFAIDWRMGSYAAIPEPATASLFGIVALTLIVRNRRRLVARPVSV